MTVIDWPAWATGKVEAFPYLETTNQSGGVGMDAIEQIVSGENRKWVMRITVGKLNHRHLIKWRSFIHSLQGRANPFRFQVWNSFALPISGPIPDGGISTVSTAAPIGSTIIDLSGYSGENISVGGLFSINDFLYEVSNNDAGSVTFIPPLREAVSEGAEVKISGPTILFRLAKDEGGRIYPQGMRAAQPVSFSAVECFQR
jgi:hypothetical protein